jgi:hypothetical protein
MDLSVVGGPTDLEILLEIEDSYGWRWRARWRGVNLGAWNDADGVAVVADIGPWNEWVGLAGHPPDPSPEEALTFAIDAIQTWAERPENADALQVRSSGDRTPGDPPLGGG